MLKFGIESGIQSFPFLLESREERDNSVKFIIALPVVEENRKATIGKDAGKSGLGKILSNCSPIYPSTKDVYEVVFDNYILYLTGNESYFSWNAYDKGRGDYFLIFEQSRLLELLPKIADMGIIQAYDGETYKHYGIRCQNHTIDIITAHEPIITKHEP